MSQPRTRSYNQFATRVDVYRNQAFPNGMELHKKASHAAFSTMCSFPDSNIDLPHWNCVLKCCSQCPKLIIPDEELNDDATMPFIKFNVYMDVSKYSLHGQLPVCDGIKCSKFHEEDINADSVKIFTKKILPYSMNQFIHFMISIINLLLTG